MEKWNKGVPPLYPQLRDGESINVTCAPMNIEDLKARQQKYLRTWAVVPVDMQTTSDLVGELRESASAIESLQRELDRSRSTIGIISDALSHTERQSSQNNSKAQTLENENRRLILDLEEARKDGERLDVIESLVLHPGPGDYYIEHRFKGGGTFREAVDAARQPYPNTPTTTPGAT